MKRDSLFYSVLGLLVSGALFSVGCRSRGGIAAPQDLVEKAALEATAIVQQAQATALVLQAQAQATAVVNKANTVKSEPIPESTWMAYLPTAMPTEEIVMDEKVDRLPNDLSTIRENSVEVISVGLAGEGSFIMIRFYAPADIAERWWQGSVSIEDESNGQIYNEIPVMPKIGPLIGRPKQDGQLGYVMLVNASPGLQNGGLVTVTLGEYRFEHIPVQ